MTWYNGSGGSPAENANCLAICYESGKCQLMKHHMDDGLTCHDSIVIFLVMWQLC